MSRGHRVVALAAAVVLVLGTGGTASAFAVLGTGTGALAGNDLTDLGDDGDEAAYAPPNLAGFDAVFFGNDEPGFDPPGTPNTEQAFDVFDNLVGGWDRKWCCGDPAVMPLDGPGEIVGANFATTLARGANAIVLTAFTLTSGNDTPGRDPAVWRIEGSNDTTTGLDGSWTTIYARATAGSSDWGNRNEVIRYSPADDDLFLTDQPFKAFRMVTTETAVGNTSGAFFQLNEIELYGTVVPEPTTLALLALGGLALARRRRRRAL